MHARTHSSRSYIILDQINYTDTAMPSLSLPVVIMLTRSNLLAPQASPEGPVGGEDRQRRRRRKRQQEIPLLGDIPCVLYLSDLARSF